jgi:uncharacterized membrane protein (DUF2068 family)
MAYKALLGSSEIVVGVLLAVPSFDPQATFARLSAEELRKDPGDRAVALISRHLPALLHHRGLVAVGLILFGLAKLIAAAAMWEGHEWGGYLLAASVALLLPFDVRQAVASPTAGHVLLALANAAALVILVLLLQGWLPGRPLLSPPDR